MATIDTSGLMKYKDASGNIYALYPITTRDNVDGLEYVDNHIADMDNPHATTADQVGAISRDGVLTSGTGSAYTATIPGISTLKAGISFVMIPHTVSTTSSPTLNLNGLGAKNIRRRVSSGSSTTTDGGSTNWLSANSPVFVTYNGTFWITALVTPNAVDITGTVPVAKGGTGVTTLDELKNLVQNDTWKLTTATDITSSSNLNSYTDIGNYRCGANSVATTLSNGPYTSMVAFIMKVYSSVGVTSGTSMYRVQEVIPINPTAKPIARRHFYTSNSGSTWTFTDWVYDLNSNNWDEYVTLAGASGMTREFTTGAISVASYTTSTDKSKIYTVTLKDSNGYQHSIVVDYKAVQYCKDSNNVFGCNFASIDNNGKVSMHGLICTYKSGGTIQFSINNSGDRIVQICGFY